VTRPAFNFRETLKVTERRDDTTKPGGESRPAREHGRYYYDDATGYEPYDPEEEAEDEAGQEDDGRAAGATTADAATLD
jgi:hypothetical protein